LYSGSRHRLFSQDRWPHCSRNSASYMWCCFCLFSYFSPLHSAEALEAQAIFAESIAFLLIVLFFNFKLVLFIFISYAVLYSRQAILARSMASLFTEFIFFFCLGSGFRGLSTSLLLVCGYRQNLMRVCVRGFAGVINVCHTMNVCVHSMQKRSV